ncbi:MAG: hypothetical protein WBY67_06970 [Pseudolabrys sp.]
MAVTFRNFLIARIALLTICAVALASCETDTTGPTPGVRPNADAPRPQGGPVTNSEPMTHSRAARECWMRTEKGSAHENLDKRAELVNKCIDEKMKAAGAPSPRT